MASGIIAKKVGMTQVFNEDGESVSVTVLEAGPCRVLQVKTLEKDGYNAVQVGFEQMKSHGVSQAIKGHQKGIEKPYRVLREFRNFTGVEHGAEYKADVFESGQKVKVTGVSKGKGFAGVMKRYGFGGGRATHGSGFHRSPGSLNATTTPGRVFKGKPMPGHKGHKRIAAKNLEIIKVDAVENLLFVKGSVPGPRSGYVTVEAQQ